MKTEILKITAKDGYNLDVKLTQPDDINVNKVVIFINASGPFTYNTKRKIHNGIEFNYFDLFHKEFIHRNIAFCSYSTRGVRDGEIPPTFVEINEEEYKTYIPCNSISDVESIISYIRSIPKFHNSKIILLGWSEGTIIAPRVVLNNNVSVDALLLAGYCNENLRDILEWQLSGNSILVNWNKFFDYDNKGYFTKEDFELDKYNVRKAIFQNQTFENIDLNKDGVINIQDVAPLCTNFKKDLLGAIEENNDEWLKNNYGVRLTSAWFKEHFSLEPNSKILPKINIPIHIFHGDCDASCPVQYAFDVKKILDEYSKDNLKIHIFNKHDHDLNYLQYILRNELSEGLKDIFQTAEEI